MKTFEANFDGLVGPTHNYAGLSEGNVASKLNANDVSSPKSAALQGLKKMKALHDMGMVQGVFAPQERPDIFSLRRLGFAGSDAQVLEKAYQQAPAVLSACCSASSMWTANAATVSPSADTNDNKVHFTPANLTNKFHRSLEPETTGNILKSVFADDKHFTHHLHLNDNDHFGDEGAANHTRLCSEYGEQGVEIFTFGKYAFNSEMPIPKKYPARQTLEASRAVARLHGLSDDKVVFVQQNPDVIDQGVFHNDVISVGNQNVLFYHEQAFLNSEAFLAEVQQKFGAQDLHFIKVASEQVSVADCVSSYLFNTQIITLANGEMAIIAPMHCRDNPRVKAYLDDLVNQNTPIKQVKYFDVNESMKNGGGPACLRLRVAMNEAELNAVNQHCVMSDALYTRLTDWVNKHYRDTLCFDDLRDPELLVESREALDHLTQILNIGSVYRFQQ
ncbi:N-succinylarginine dihydrolase [Thalassotalea ponticola]|uniref:N-succinylarginine dihydrolase n=1 Tax=Thalassotalea ponticola TaxID=1523392 RepID=UPI0025B56FA7|nr:N-succinylarginine dihydrolase [Thalassotalea ponticola]MDN3652218.1 N-succinylarginine dihydrolase [Thalassotalea ponticola]